MPVKFKYILLIIILAQIGNTSLFGQHETNIWYFGENAGIDFQDGNPKALTDGALNTMEGVAAISDGDGNLLFYTNGITVWNRHHKTMKNGFGLMGHKSSTQSGIIVPMPGSNHIYYIFTVDEVGGKNGFRYSIVDMTKENGIGAIVKKNVLLYTPTTEKVTAVLHHDNREVWIITHEWESNAFKTFRLSEYGLSVNPVVSRVGSMHFGNKKNNIGYMKVSPKGNRIALTIRELNRIEILDFDNVTGKVSNPITIESEEWKMPYGVEFSPDGTKLYITTSRLGSAIYQIDLTEKNYYDMIDNAILIHEVPESNVFFALQLGPDGHIYVAKYQDEHLSVIKYPNRRGKECDYIDDYVDLAGRRCNLGLPTFVQSFFVKRFRIVDTLNVSVGYFDKRDGFVMGAPVFYDDTMKINGVVVQKNYYKRTDTLYTRDTSRDVANISAFIVDDSSNYDTNPDITIEEFFTNSLHPLLNYVFFDENSSVLPDRYDRLDPDKTADYNIERQKDKGTLEIYRDILNIVGYRMKKYPEAKLSIIGCNSGIGNEKGNTGLSAHRAESVLKYLTDVWKIDPMRLNIVVRDLPETPSVPIDQPDKMQENSRVEMYSDVYEIFSPVHTRDTILKITPELIRFSYHINEKSDIRNWKINIFQRELGFNQEIDIDSLGEYVDWNIQNYLIKKDKKADSLHYNMSYVDGDINYKTEDRTLPIKNISIGFKRDHNLPDIEINRVSLILFSFSKSIISGANKKIADFIRQKIKPNTRVKILGFTDRTGERSFNRNLSLQRALETKEALGIKNAVLTGIGEDILLYNNDLPEGRFYCRTVKILLETPL